MEEVEKLKNELAAAQAKLTEKDAQINGMSQELAGDRAKRQDLQAERDVLSVKVKELEGRIGGVQPTNVSEEVQKALLERDRQQAETNRTSAESSFKSRKDFTPEADPGEIKFNAVKKKFAMFDTSKLKTTEEFLAVWQDAYRLVNNQTHNTHIQNNQDMFSRNSGGAPREVETSQLTSEERSVVQRMGWTDDQFLKQKTKRPQYVESLMRGMRS